MAVWWCGGVVEGKGMVYVAFNAIMLVTKVAKNDDKDDDDYRVFSILRRFHPVG